MGETVGSKAPDVILLIRSAAIRTAKRSCDALSDFLMFSTFISLSALKMLNFSSSSLASENAPSTALFIYLSSLSTDMALTPTNVPIRRNVLETSPP
jgi:hypothetical protein